MDEHGWTKVVHKRSYPVKKTKIVKQFWDGFDSDGNQFWFIEFSSGRIVSKGWFPKK